MSLQRKGGFRRESARFFKGVALYGHWANANSDEATRTNDSSRIFIVIASGATSALSRDFVNERDKKGSITLEKNLATSTVTLIRNYYIR